MFVDKVNELNNWTNNICKGLFTYVDAIIANVTNANIKHDHMMNGIHSHGFPFMIS
jgi:hypothetical protein